MATKKTTKKAETAVDVFGYTEIVSNTCSSLSNDFSNSNELRRVLQGKPICAESILDAMEKVHFAKYDSDHCGIHSFFPDKGKCFVGKVNRDNGKVYASVEISWTVKDPSVVAMEKLTAVLDKLLDKLSK